ncbi:MAG: flotillin-like FloA family protein, partial [Planctomycetota bacterium]
ATEETIIARVGQGIVAAIGGTETHLQVLETPDRISKKVLLQGLDTQTSFEIVSIDIAEVDVGRNIGAELQANQAEANMRMARAEAEKRAAMARALEQEMKAAVEENRAKVVAAEAEVPKALAEALRSGHMGVMDYYNLRNVLADTHMRQQIGGGKAGNI